MPKLSTAIRGTSDTLYGTPMFRGTQFEKHCSVP